MRSLLYDYQCQKEPPWHPGKFLHTWTQYMSMDEVPGGIEPTSIKRLEMQTRAAEALPEGVLCVTRVEIDARRRPDATYRIDFAFQTTINTPLFTPEKIAARTQPHP